jgi:hypothetical protein
MMILNTIANSLKDDFRRVEVPEGLKVKEAKNMKAVKFRW